MSTVIFDAWAINSVGTLLPINRKRVIFLRYVADNFGNILESHE